MLTNAAAKAAGAQSRAYKLFDQGGLFLFVAPTGLKSWRMKFRLQGREQLLTIGRFPEVSLAQARIARDQARAQLATGADPRSGASAEASGTFEQLARAWHRHNLPTWSPAHAADVLASLERDILPDIGGTAPGDIDAPALLNALRSVERRGRVTTAQRIRQRLAEIFAFGIAEGLCSGNPAADLGAAMKEVPPAVPHPSLAAIEDCRALLAACDRVGGRASTLLASRFLALTAVRLDSVRGMRWSEIEDLDGPAPLWRVPPERLKLKRSKKDEVRFEHLVPLSAAAVQLLREAANLRDSAISQSDLVFPGRSGTAPIGEGAIGELYQRAGFAGRHVPHGWRASFSTILNEQLGEGWSTLIDAALGHAKSDKIEAAYNRSQRLGRRRELFDSWGAMLAAATSE